MILDQTTVDRFAENLRSRGKQPATVESYCRDAQGFLEYLQRCRLSPTQIEPVTLIAYQEYLRGDLTERDNSIRRTVIGIRQFFRFLHESRLLQGSPFDSVPIPQRDDRIPKSLLAEAIDRILTQAQRGAPPCKGARDAALVALLAFEGIKANELIALRWRDLLSETDTSSLHIGGSRARSIRLGTKSHELLLNYRKHYQLIDHPVIKSSPDKHMFLAFKGRDASFPLPSITRHGLKFVLYELGEKVGIDSLNTEQLRHFAVTHLLAEGKAPDEIMTHLGLRRLGNIAKHLAAAPLASLASDAANSDTSNPGQI
jgi:integrase/recombinase XerD